MPVPLSEKPHSKAVRAEGTIDWLALWAVSMGLASVCFGAIAFFTVGDAIGACAVLLGGAALIALALYGSRSSERHYY